MVGSVDRRIGHLRPSASIRGFTLRCFCAFLWPASTSSVSFAVKRLAFACFAWLAGTQGIPLADSRRRLRPGKTLRARQFAARFPAWRTSARLSSFSHVSRFVRAGDDCPAQWSQPTEAERTTEIAANWSPAWQRKHPSSREPASGAFG